MRFSSPPAALAGGVPGALRPRSPFLARTEVCRPSAAMFVGHHRASTDLRRAVHSRMGMPHSLRGQCGCWRGRFAHSQTGRRSRSRTRLPALATGLATTSPATMYGTCRRRSGLRKLVRLGSRTFATISPGRVNVGGAGSRESSLPSPEAAAVGVSRYRMVSRATRKGSYIWNLTRPGARDGNRPKAMTAVTRSSAL